MSAHKHDIVCHDFTKISFILAMFVLCEYKQWLYNWTTIWTFMHRAYVKVKVTNGVQSYTCNFLFVYIILFNGCIMSALYLIHVYYGKRYLLTKVHQYCKNIKRYAFLSSHFFVIHCFIYNLSGPFVTLCDTSGFYAGILPAMLEWLLTAL